MSTVIFLLSTFLVSWTGAINIAKVFKGESIPWGNFVLFALGLTGVVAGCMGVY
jgi:hypothetical protein